MSIRCSTCIRISSASASQRAQSSAAVGRWRGFAAERRRSRRSVLETRSRSLGARRAARHRARREPLRTMPATAPAPASRRRRSRRGERGSSPAPATCRRCSDRRPALRIGARSRRRGDRVSRSAAAGGRLRIDSGCTAASRRLGVDAAGDRSRHRSGRRDGRALPDRCRRAVVADRSQRDDSSVVVGQFDDRRDLDLLDRVGELGNVVERDRRAAATPCGAGVARGAPASAIASVSSGISVSIARARLRRISASACSSSSRAVGMRSGPLGEIVRAHLVAARLVELPALAARRGVGLVERRRSRPAARSGRRTAAATGAG